MHATILRLLGFDPARFSYKFQDLDQRLIGVGGEGITGVYEYSDLGDSMNTYGDVLGAAQGSLCIVVLK